MIMEICQQEMKCISFNNYLLPFASLDPWNASVTLEDTKATFAIDPINVICSWKLVVKVLREKTLK